MVKGVGADLVDIKRIRALCKRWNGAFLKKVFTEEELHYCNGKSDPYPSLAGRFAAKEAIMKALGFGFPAISFKDIEITNSFGAPKAILLGKAKEIGEKQNVSSIFISISHIDCISCAFAVIE